MFRRSFLKSFSVCEQEITDGQWHHCIPLTKDPTPVAELIKKLTRKDTLILGMVKLNCSCNEGLEEGVTISCACGLSEADAIIKYTDALHDRLASQQQGMEKAITLFKKYSRCNCMQAKTEWLKPMCDRCAAIKELEQNK